MDGIIIRNCHQEKSEIPKEYAYCIRCKRKLTNPKYKQIGYGPVCYEKIKIKNKYKLF